VIRAAGAFAEKIMFDQKLRALIERPKRLRPGVCDKALRRKIG
jgi:hypothetical protein